MKSKIMKAMFLELVDGKGQIFRQMKPEYVD